MGDKTRTHQQHISVTRPAFSVLSFKENKQKTEAYLKAVHSLFQIEDETLHR
jgi:hypothetical protein